MSGLSRHWHKYRSIYYIYQGGLIVHGTHVLGTVSTSDAECEYNAGCTTGKAYAHFRMLIHELLNKDPDIFPEEYPLIILYRKSVVCMAKNGKDNNHKSHIARRVNFVKEW